MVGDCVVGNCVIGNGMVEGMAGGMIMVVGVTIVVVGRN